MAETAKPSLPRLAVFASHGGTILQAVLDAVADGSLPLQVVLVVSNNSGAQALERARRAGVPTRHLSSRQYPDAGDLDAALLAAVQDAGADLILLAGFMKRLGPRLLEAYAGRILNTHPALLPKFGGAGYYGRRVHEAVLAAGERESGASVHLVDTDYDEGPLISQVRVPIRPGDTVETLEERVKTAERKLVVATLAEFTQPERAAGY